MPNHCHNDLYIEGPKAQVGALLSLVGADQPEPDFKFSAVIPYPADFEARDDEFNTLSREQIEAKYGKNAKNGYNSGGYEWCIANWGTKWSGYEVVRRDYGGTCLTFQTAWSPPKPIVIALGKLFPELTLHLEYFERGSAFCGGFSVLSKDDWYEDGEWFAGVPANAWEGKYCGNRGG